MARPEKPIDWNQVELSIMAGCSQNKIVSAAKVDKTTFIRQFKKRYKTNFTNYATDKSQYGEVLLEVAQFQKALKSSSPGNTQMLIWLGKVRLGQREPEPLTQNAVKTEQCNKENIIMEKNAIIDAQAQRIAELEAGSNDNKSKAKQELLRSDSSLQYMGRRDQIGEDVFIDS